MGEMTIKSRTGEVFTVPTGRLTVGRGKVVYEVLGFCEDAQGIYVSLQAVRLGLPPHQRSRAIYLGGQTRLRPVKEEK